MCAAGGLRERLSETTTRRVDTLHAGGLRATEAHSCLVDRMRYMPDDYRIRQVMQCVEQDPSKSVVDLARLVNLSSSRLGHLFRLQIGVALNSFVRTARLERAAALLQETELSIKEIAAAIGYHHASSFDRGFEKKFGYAPADYRKKQRR
jgi:transcriptional regulator GlxA family with amidase domain